jgi:hypothetical protein
VTDKISAENETNLHDICWVLAILNKTLLSVPASEMFSDLWARLDD